MQKVLVFNRLSRSMAPYDEWFSEYDIEWKMLGWSDIAESYDQKISSEFYEHYANEKLTKDAYDYCRYENPSSIINTSEFDVLRAAQLRDRFDIKGQREDNATAFRDKIAMKNKAAAAGVRVPAFALVKNAVDILNFIEQQGYPIIIKPVLGAGSIGVSRVDDESQLEDFLNDNIIDNLNVESFIEGKMYQIDGLIIDGEYKVIWPHAYPNDGTLGFANGEHQGNYTLGVDNPLTSRLIAFTKTVLKALDAPLLTAFHCEVFHTRDDEITLCEVACRLGGGRIVPVLNAAFDIDVYQHWVKAQAGIQQDFSTSLFPKRMSGHILYLPRCGTYTGPTTFKELDWAEELIINVVPGRYYNAEHSVDFAGSAVVIGHSEEDVRQKLAEVEEVFDTKMTWSAEYSQAKHDE